MGIETLLFKSEEKKSRADVSGFLRLLADKLDCGQITLIQEGSEVVLNVPGEITLEVTAEEKDKREGVKRSLEIELEWYEGDIRWQPSGVTLG